MAENLLHLSGDESMGQILAEAGCVDNFISDQCLEMDISDTNQVKVPDSWDSNSGTSSFQKFFTKIVNGILRSSDKNDVEGVGDKLNEMAVLNVKYTKNDPQEIDDSSQDTCKRSGCRLSDTKLASRILEEEYDASVLLDYLTNTFYTKDEFGSAEDVQFLELLSDMDISKSFDNFDDFFEKYHKCLGKISGNHLLHPNL